MAGPEHHRRQRERILDAARPLFAQRGFDNVSVAEIAVAAGTSRATVFNQFGSKAGLVSATFAGVMSFYEAMLEEALSTEAPTAELIRDLFRQMGAGIEIDRAYFRGIFREVARLQTGMAEGDEGHVVLERAKQRLEELFERGVERGEVDGRHPAAGMALMMNAVSNATITDWLYGDADDSLVDRMVVSANLVVAAVEVRP